MYWNIWPQLGEMFGSMILTFGVLIILFFAKKKSFNLNTPLRKRVFLGFSIPIAIILGLIAGKGFGAPGQLNPAITLMVAGIEGHYEWAPAVIAFQFIGAIAAVAIFLLAVLALEEWNQLAISFSFIDQSVPRTATIEIIGNMFWLIPIAAMVVAYLKQNIDFFELALAAGFGKMLLVGIFEEFGAANFNPQIWLGKFIVTFIAKKRITKRELLAEMTGLVTTLAVGAAMGPLGKVFNDNLEVHYSKVGIHK